MGQRRDVPAGEEWQAQALQQPAAPHPPSSPAKPPSPFPEAGQDHVLTHESGGRDSGCSVVRHAEVDWCSGPHRVVRRGGGRGLVARRRGWGRPSACWWSKCWCWRRRWGAGDAEEDDACSGILTAKINCGPTLIPTLFDDLLILAASATAADAISSNARGVERAAKGVGVRETGPVLLGVIVVQVRAAE